MGEPARKRMTYAEYVEQELRSEEKHEFVDGEPFAMSGGTRTHSRLGVRVVVSLDAALRGRPCEVHGSDMRLAVEATGNSYYPDAMVICGGFQTVEGDDHAVTNPSLVVEVSSPSSAAYDRGLKFVNYQAIPTLLDYLVLSQAERRLWHYQRIDSREWRIRELTEGEVALGIGVTLAIEDLYAGIDLA